MSLFLNIQPNTFTFNGGTASMVFGGAGLNSKSPHAYTGNAALTLVGAASTQKARSSGPTTGGSLGGTRIGSSFGRGSQIGMAKPGGSGIWRGRTR